MSTFEKKSTGIPRNRVRVKWGGREQTKEKHLVLEFSDLDFKIIVTNVFKKVNDKVGNSQKNSNI